MQSKPGMTEFVINMLKEQIPAAYHYHDYHHTLYVTHKAILIGKNEFCTPDEMDLLRIAALWHDTGFIKMYDNHEAVSCELAHEYLPKFGVDAQDSARICGIIMATKIPQTPTSKLGEILADADLEYLGSNTAEETSELLYEELKGVNPDLTRADWNQRQVDFLQSHTYFTNYCRQHSEPLKQEYLKKLLKGVHRR